MNKRLMFILFVIIGAICIFLIRNKQNKLEVKVESPICKNCNVVLITLDTLSAQHLPCYGYSKNTASNLCKFAKDNVLFKNAYSADNWTPPSHISIFTSLLPQTHKKFDFASKPLDPQYKTITEILKSNGYNTLFYGPSDIPPFPYKGNLDRGFDETGKSKYLRYDVDSWRAGLNKIKENQSKGVPTFVFYQTWFVHDPYLPNDPEHLSYTVDQNGDIPLTDEQARKMTPKKVEILKQFLARQLNMAKKNGDTNKLADAENTITTFNKAKKMEDYESFLNDRPILRDNFYHFWYTNLVDSKDTRGVNYLKALYDQRIADLDKDFGYFLDMVSKMDNTIVIIESDHGEAFAEHQTLNHGRTLYNEEIKVPLIMKIPGISNREVNKVASTIDIMPTVLGLVGINSPNNIQGVNLSNGIFDKNSIINRDYVVAETVYEKAYIGNKWKLYIRDLRDTTRDTWELYNIENDPGEKNNVIKANENIVDEILSTQK